MCRCHFGAKVRCELDGGVTGSAGLPKVGLGPRGYDVESRDSSALKQIFYLVPV